MPNCNTSDLSIYTPNGQMPWNTKRIQHLHRRLGFSLSKSDLDNALTQTPSDYIENLFSQAVNLGSIPPPSWQNMTYNQYTDPDTEIPLQHDELYFHFVNDMLDNGLRGRFTLFWHNHFVTRLEDYWCPSWMYKYYKTLHDYNFGNFKEFVRAIGITPAMLVYLNGYQNTVYEPNENYARELLELFTLGEGNGYNQSDIVNIAKALTGYTGITEYCGNIFFSPSDFDSGQKTFFGQTGNWDYDDVINILFQERGDLIATHICTKLYGYFISPDINETIVSQLATTFVDNNFELLPVYKQLFKSKHFFDEVAISGIVKSPYDIFISFVNETSFELSQDYLQNIIWFNYELGQEIFNPVDVAGWQGNHDWINSSTIIGRWQYFEWYLWDVWDNNQESLRDFAISIASSTETDPSIITQKIVDFFISNGLQSAADYAVATDVFKDQVPQNYYDNNLWNLQWSSVPYQVLVLLMHITKLPEFQLK
jgi:hypothetical protein